MNWGGDVIILKQFQRVEGTKSITSFEIKSPRSGRYYISFWLCPPKLNDGTFAGYDVSVNDTGVAGKILPNHGDWQSISLSDGEMIELKKGLNTVSIIGMIPDIPSVEHIRVSSTRSNSIIDGCKYDSYKSDIILICIMREEMHIPHLPLWLLTRLDKPLHTRLPEIIWEVPYNMQAKTVYDIDILILLGE